MSAWVNHAAMNFGALLSSVWHALLPPQWTGHSPKTLADLARKSLLNAFLEGVKGRPDRR